MYRLDPVVQDSRHKRYTGSCIKITFFPGSYVVQFLSYHGLGSF